MTSSAVHNFGSLLADLATICLNTIAPADPALPGFRLVTTPTRFSGGPSTCSAAKRPARSEEQAGLDLTPSRSHGTYGQPVPGAG